MRGYFVVAIGLIVTSACSLSGLDGYTTEPDGASDAGSETGADAAGDTSSPPSSEAGADTGAPDPYGDAVRADGPVAWYRFEEDPIANAAKDSAGNRTANLIGGSMGFGAKGISGRGIATNAGGGNGFTLGNDLGFAGATPFSLEVWLEPKSTAGDQYIFHKRESVGDSLRGWIFYLGEDLSPHFENWGTAMSARSDSPLPSGYVHVVLTVSFDGAYGLAKLWLNAQPQPLSFGEEGASTPATSAPLEFLASFAGEADELAIYDKALTADRILAHYVAGKP